MEKQRTLMKNATQKYRIETNKDFDIAEYVKNRREAARKKREAEAAAEAANAPKANAPQK
jgi:hypothetical protein